jgi:hypothetical protein
MSQPSATARPSGTTDRPPDVPAKVGQNPDLWTCPHCQRWGEAEDFQGGNICLRCSNTKLSASADPQVVDEDDPVTQIAKLQADLATERKESELLRGVIRGVKLQLAKTKPVWLCLGGGLAYVLELCLVLLLLHVYADYFHCPTWLTTECQTASRS